MGGGKLYGKHFKQVQQVGEYIESEGDVVGNVDSIIPDSDGYMLLFTVTDQEAERKQYKVTELKPWSLTDFNIGRPLGCGVYGNVYLARRNADKHIMAMKVMYKNQYLGLSLTKEYCLHEVCSGHPNVLGLYGFFSDTTRYYSMLEYAPSGRMKIPLDNPAMALRYLTKITSAIKHCHTKGIVHKDIKPDNILMSSDEPLLSDFGLSEKIGSKEMQEHYGTPLYMAPEFKSLHVDEKIDIWALGVLLYEMLKGEIPDDIDPSDDFPEILREDEDISASMLKILKLCLRQDPKDRPSADDLLQVLSSVMSQCD